MFSFENKEVPEIQFSPDGIFNKEPRQPIQTIYSIDSSLLVVMNNQIIFVGPDLKQQAIVSLPYEKDSSVVSPRDPNFEIRSIHSDLKK